MIPGASKLLVLGVVVLTTGLFSLVEAQTLERSQR